jgi:hypothetical protein
MPIKNPNTSSNKGGVPLKPILRAEIEEAQRHTDSNRAAARWLGVSYDRYRKYAKLYDLFDRHLNPRGVGIDKGFSKRPTNTPLREILAGMHPRYSPAKLKNRLIARKKLVEECSLCGFRERRITDGRVPLMLNFMDGNHTNFELANLNLLCYNCMFLTTGAPSVVNKLYNVEKSFRTPEKVPTTEYRETTFSDSIDLDEDYYLDDVILTDEEKQQLLEHREEL